MKSYRRFTHNENILKLDIELDKHIKQVEESPLPLSPFLTPTKSVL